MGVDQQGQTTRLCEIARTDGRRDYQYRTGTIWNFSGKRGRVRAKAKARLLDHLPQDEFSGTERRRFGISIIWLPVLNAGWSRLVRHPRQPFVPRMCEPMTGARSWTGASRKDASDGGSYPNPGQHNE